MSRMKKEQPAPGGAVREPIKDMLASGSEQSFTESLPEVTTSETMGDSPEEIRVRRKRRTKEEIAREKGAQPKVPIDERLERAKAKAAGLGGAALIESGFRVSGKPLNTEEDEDLKDQFYLISVKAGIDPSGSWLFVILYTVALLARLVLSRTELGEQIKKLFMPKKEGGEEKNEQGKSSGS